MKKNLMTLAAILCCAMTMTVFTACGDDKDDDNTPQAKEIKGIGARYIFNVTEQMSQLCDYNMTYYGISGELTTEKATWTTKDGVATWQKDVSNTVLPATFGLKVSAEVKNDAQLEGMTIDNVYPITKHLYVEGIYTDATKAWGKNFDLVASVTQPGVDATRLPSYIEIWERHGGIVNQNYTFDKDGNQVASGKIE